MVRERKKDDEFLTLFIIAFLGLGVLFLVNLFYSDWPGMADTFWHWGAIIGVLGIAAVVAFVVIMFDRWKDPNYDKYRHCFWVGALIMVIYICAFKAFNNESNSVIDDSNQAKQEQAK